MDIAPSSLTYTGRGREIIFEGKRGKAVAESDRGQPGVGELNKITAISVYTEDTRPEFYCKTSL
jgi:hypothetical protein